MRARTHDGVSADVAHWLALVRRDRPAAVDGGERSMNTDNRAAAVMGAAGGLLVSVVAATDYAMNGKLVERHESLVNWSHGVGFALMLVGMVAVTGRCRSVVSRTGRVVLYIFTGLLGLFTVVSTPGLADRLAFLEPVAGVCFLGMFVLGTWAGIALWRQTGCSRLGAVLLALGSPMIILVLAVGALGWFRVHAALAEIPVYLGIAVLSLERLAPRPALVPSAATG
jgi:hypothetical protein